MLHPLDLIGGDLIRELAFFQGMDVEADKKVRIFKEVISCIVGYFKLANMLKNEKNLLGNDNLRVKYAGSTSF